MSLRILDTEHSFDTDMSGDFFRNRSNHCSFFLDKGHMEQLESLKSSQKLDMDMLRCHGVPTVDAATKLDSVLTANLSPQVTSIAKASTLTRGRAFQASAKHDIDSDLVQP